MRRISEVRRGILVRCRAVCKEYYTLNMFCMHPIQVHCSALLEISGKIPHQYGWNEISSMFYTFSVAGRNFPRVHIRVAVKDHRETFAL